MARFGTALSSYSIAQLAELLEDDEKLNHIVLELEEDFVKKVELKGPMSCDTVLKIFYQSCRAVQHMHKQKPPIIHRDLKVQEVQQNKKTILASNRSLAEQNLILQPGLDHQKNELTKHYRCLREQFEAFQLRKSTLDHKSGDMSLDTLLALLQTEGAKIEEETENMADSFLDGAVTLDSFIDEYQNKRKLAHLRRVKIEKLQELVLKSPAAVQVPPHIEPASTPAPLQREPDSAPGPQPRRAPPLPPIKNGSVQSPSAPELAFSATPYPPIPPRVRQPQPGYPSLCMPQYPPPVPQRSAPRMTPQPGFILQ